MGNPSTKRASRRCPSCGSRVPELASVCEVCGHEFGTTQAIPPVQPKTERMAKPATQATPAPKQSLASRLPWGVIGVVAVIIGLLAGAMLLLRNGGLPTGASPTVQVIVNTAEAGAATEAETPTD